MHKLNKNNYFPANMFVLHLKNWQDSLRPGVYKCDVLCKFIYLYPGTKLNQIFVSIQNRKKLQIFSLQLQYLVLKSKLTTEDNYFFWLVYPDYVLIIICYKCFRTNGPNRDCVTLRTLTFYM